MVQPTSLPAPLSPRRNPRPRMALRRVVALIAVAAPVLLITGCYQFKKAPNSPEKEKVVRAVEEVLQERYYQTRSYRTSGHVFALTYTDNDGNYPRKRRVDVHVVPERTGHYIPRVYVRTMMDIAEPPLENGDRFIDFDVEGNPFADSNWTAVYYDRQLESELRKAIYEKLNIPVK